MNLFDPKKRKFIGGTLAMLLIGVVLTGFFAFGSFALAQSDGTANPAGAVAETAGATQDFEKPTVGTANSPGNPTGGIPKALKVLDDKILKPALQAAFFTIMQNVIQGLMDRLAYEAAIFIVTGAEGGTPLIQQQYGQEYWQNLGLDIAGDAVGGLSQFSEGAFGFNICTPPNPVVALSLQLGIKQAYQPAEPRCDILEVGQNWEEFINSQLQFAEDPGDAIMKEFAKSLKPGRNELSASIDTNLKVFDAVGIKKSTDFLQAMSDGGFQPVRDTITGQVKTPSNVIQNDFNNRLRDSNKTSLEVGIDTLTNNPNIMWMMLFQSLSVFTNTLLSQMFNKIYTGLFEPTPVIDPFSDIGLADTNNREAAIEQFRSLRTPTPTQISDYNALAEFVVCPAAGVNNRNINNCVINEGFAAAIARSEGGEGMTVAQAIEEELINPDWPLIHPNDLAKNQDPFCHSYGFCYGNLVKLRKARIIPVGWEIAAERNSISNPATLGEIIAGFDKCGPGGSLGDSGDTKWCHLIDPNWVLKYPETQCKAFATGEILISSLSPGRASTCVDTPSCIAEDSNGECLGFGYCVEEENTWRFRGDECPEQFSSCLSFTNTSSNETEGYLLSTVDFSVCNASNAGCRWYRTQKKLVDDSFEFFGEGEEYVGVFWDNALEHADSSRTAFSEFLYTHEERQYYNRDIESCLENDAGCSEVFRIADTLSLNVIPNPSFEDDENGDGIADFWDNATNDTREESFDNATNGTFSLTTTNALSQTGIAIAPNAFYTLTFDVRAETAGADLAVSFSLLTPSGAPADTTGLSTNGDCVPAGIGDYDIFASDISTDYAEFTCTFTTPSDASLVELVLGVGSGTVRFDSVQLAFGENPRAFTEAYNEVQTSSFLKLPPDYLGCTGAATDPQECAQYTQVCSAADVGCNLYQPEDGDPSVPAIISELDQCPSECVGYASFKQEATKYESDAFPLFFIADTASQCSQPHIGCDSFTNLDALAEGGEGVESYTDLRACLPPVVADVRAGTFFTWEGSDSEGFQLQSWQLLTSNLASGTLINYTEGSGVDDSFGGDAPCTTWRMDSESNLVCDDSVAELEADDGCNEHADIFSEPDCREFFDANGNIHYRRHSATVTISNECSPYRKTDADQVNCISSGGFFTDAGECRYFGLASESVSCPASAVGCRAFTGGTGRNATTIFDETFEDGTFEGFEGVGSVTVSPSGESLAPDGTSLRIDNASVGEGVQTTYDIAEDPPGPLADQLVAGKVFVVDFWAKGDGDIRVQFVEEDGAGTPQDFAGNPVALDGAWRLYSVGPMDTTLPAFANFDETALLRFVSDGAVEFFIDNIQLKQLEENITLIKDSWVTPSTCDTAPNGLPQPQFYLGCESYTDQNNNEVDLYQFTRLCEEQVVGCEAYYDSQNSESPYAQVFNARCVIDLDGDVENIITDPLDAQFELASSPTACSVDGEEKCTISTGNNHCLFTEEGGLRRPLASNVVLGPEAVVVSGDTPRFLVDNGQHTCSAAAVGCEEVGVPTFNQAKTGVLEFTPAFLINDPDRYEDQLCTHEALFCDEWTSTHDGNFYFKHPIDQTCEYKTNVSIGTREFDGWFKTGTNDPCDEDLLTGGEQYGIALNGDDFYDGWYGQCDNQHNRCTTFRDPIDTQNGKQLSGKPYHFIDNDALQGEGGLVTVRCDGRVSQKQGCALFHNNTVTQNLYSAEPTYLMSNHADLFFAGADQFDFVDPVDCELGGEFPTIGTNEIIDVCASRCAYKVDDGELRSGTGVRSIEDSDFMYAGACISDDDCQIQQNKDRDALSGVCVNVTEFDATGNGSTEDEIFRFGNDTNRVLSVIRDRECSAWLACSSAQLQWSEQEAKFVEVCQQTSLCREFGRLGDQGFCTAFEDSPPIPLTPNRYAMRDVTWTGKEASGYSIPNQLPIEHYGQNNINPPKWCADEFNRPQNGTVSICEASTDCSFIDTGCVNNAGCGDDYPVCDVGTGFCHKRCQDASTDHRLSFDAGACSQGDFDVGTDCSVGECEDGGEACSTTIPNSCGDDDTCVIGRCQTVTSDFCFSDDDCTDASYPVCDPIKNACVNQLVNDGQGCNLDTECPLTIAEAADDSISASCTTLDSTKFGGCYNGRCLVSISGQGFNTDREEIQECRAYPEINSPYRTSGIVERWEDFSDFDPESALDDRPQELRTGFEQVETCAPIDIDNDGNPEYTDDCTCNYQKVGYGQGVATRYYPIIYPTARMLPGICLGGENDGKSCTSDEQCNPIDPDLDPADPRNARVFSTCGKRSTIEFQYGWPGYCLERDTSIQLFGSQASADQACLTWLPVDQLRGAKDLNANFTDAGFGEEAHYCSVTDIFYDIPSSLKEEEFACAEGGHGMEGEYDNENGCFKTVYCPPGSFAVMGPAGPGGDDEPNLTSSHGCEDGLTFLGPFNPADDDCPYFCVPENAVQTGESAEDCGPPESPRKLQHIGSVDGAGLVNSALDEEDGDFFETDAWNSSGIDTIDFDAYLVQRERFNELIPRYVGCVEMGLTEEQVFDRFEQDDWMNEPDNPIDQGDVTIVYPGAPNSANFYRNLTMEAVPYLGCEEIATVSTGTAELGFNTAWTDRVWSDPVDSRYAIRDTQLGLELFVDDRFHYETHTEQVPFGKGVDLSEFEVRNISIRSPQRIAACERIPSISVGDDEGRTHSINSYSITPLGVTNSCPTGYEETSGASSGDEARAFSSLSLVSAGTVYHPILGVGIDKDCRDPEFIQAIVPEECTDDISCSFGTCLNGPLHGHSCSTTQECQDASLCVALETDPGLEGDELGDAILRAACVSTVDAIAFPREVGAGPSQRIRQIFAKSLEINRWDESPSERQYSDEVEVQNFSTLTPWDYTHEGDPFVLSGPQIRPIPPSIYSVGTFCEGTLCEEGDQNAVSVNGVDNESVFGKGSKHVTLSFYAGASKEQLPLRNVIVDWGSGNVGATTPSDTWLKEQVGSDTDDNFYKNHRGADRDGDVLTPTCTGATITEGGTDVPRDIHADSCENTSIIFTHDYVCSDTTLQRLQARGRTCQVDPATGALLNSPCTGGVPEGDNKCVYQPRVFAKDNWGWCTGFCPGGPETGDASLGGDGKNGCYDSSHITFPSAGQNECDFANCPGPLGSGCPSTSINPWVYFDSYVIVEPE